MSNERILSKENCISFEYDFDKVGGTAGRIMMGSTIPKFAAVLYISIYIQTELDADDADTTIAVIGRSNEIDTPDQLVIFPSTVYTTVNLGVYTAVQFAPFKAKFSGGYSAIELGIVIDGGNITAGKFQCTINYIEYNS